LVVINFSGGVVVAILAGFIAANWIFPALTILGLIVGLMNVTASEVQSFLLAAVSLVIVSALGADKIQGLPEVGKRLEESIPRCLRLYPPPQSSWRRSRSSGWRRIDQPGTTLPSMKGMCLCLSHG
jgi:hypothetical protein